MLDQTLRALLFIGVGFLVGTVDAQTTNATCTPAWSWALNSKQQSPCLVAAYLLAPCANGQWNVPGLQNGQYYTPPTLAGANQCTCSTVAYQLMSACGSCQQQEIVTWSSWRGNCADDLVSVASYPRAISGATAVPAWAYLNIVTTDRFNATQAQSAATLPETTAGGGASTSGASSTPASSSSPSSTPPSSSTTGSGTSTTSSADSGGSGGNNSNLGAIIGGTVGGVVGLGLIICLAIWLLKRNDKGGNRSSMPTRKRSAPSAEFSKVISPGSPMPANFDPAAVGFRSRTASPNGNGYLNGDPSRHPHLNNNPYGVSMQVMNIGAAGTGATSGGGHSNHGSVSGYSGGSPWSPPPVGHTPAPSGGGHSSVYTPAPTQPGYPYNYTPPPGAMGSQPQFTPGHAYSTSGGTTAAMSGYNPTPVSSMHANPYGGHGQPHGGAPEM